MRPHSSLKQEFLKNGYHLLESCPHFQCFQRRLQQPPPRQTNVGSRIQQADGSGEHGADETSIGVQEDCETESRESARNGTTCWSRALISNASKDGSNNHHLVKQMLGPESNRPMAAANTAPTRQALVCKKIVKRSRGIRRRRRKCVATSSITKHLARKRTQVLKSLIPGGEFMNEICLIEETLDYISSLRVQVDVMRSLARASEPK
ncbi:hypothetical protein F3Y22_tig00110890pilonHSYRG00898 [Hibiscus syriacus]|uniref:Uncharacterized protein n=1 Tax=Hibiscus syriacus TaxID=106335 RepID=A0A6A2ZJL2_HIBSY|nr:hypothetical protein F3Y22_tig00110890pilonHSYRG00898 [Hibiscus syriacus]